jgi:endonuclease YncB( thermonuclease family)
LRANLSPPCESFRKQWLQEHPHARLVQVAELSPFDQRNPKSEFLFVWITDHEDNLGVDLVRHGCAPAEALFALLPEAHLKVPQKQFEQVKDRLLAGEKLAKSEKLGLWSDEENDSSDEDYFAS